MEGRYKVYLEAFSLGLLGDLWSNEIDNQEETAQEISLLCSNVFLIYQTGKEKELHF